MPTLAVTWLKATSADVLVGVVSRWTVTDPDTGRAETVTERADRRTSAPRFSFECTCKPGVWDVRCEHVAAARSSRPDPDQPRPRPVAA